MGRSALRVLMVTGLLKVALFYGDIFIWEKKTWSDARKLCTANYTEMSSIINQEEHEALVAFQGETDWRRVWIGIYQDDSGTWKWTDGTNSSFLNWENSENPNNRKCAVVNKDKKWTMRDCETKNYFYCFHTKMVLVKEKKTWEEAMEHCRQTQRELVSMNSESALNETLRASRGAQTTRVWTGLRYLADTWLWVDGGMMNYQAWGQDGMPHCPAQLRRCGALSQEGRRWESWDCAEKLNFVCKGSTHV